MGSVLGLAAACGDSQSDDTPGTAQGGGIFGGTGGVVEAVPLAGKGGTASGGSGNAGGGSGGTATNECQGTPAGKLALLDNFDDGDNVAAFELAREAYWFTSHDETPGTIAPANDFKPEAGGYLGTKSAHVVASGYSNWGAALSANVTHKAALRCPYNASAFAGFRFVARGHGQVRVQLAMPDVIDKEYGGSCDPKAQVCYDQHGAYIQLGADFQTYELPWSSFVQRGFGPPLDFNPGSLISLSFAMEANDLPVELWLDQVEWWDGKPTETGGGGASGAGGAAGDGGTSNTAGEPWGEAGAGG